MAHPNFDRLDFNSTTVRRSEAEEKWASFQPYLLSKGYRLRPRYQPDWVPSWISSNDDPSFCEDSLDCMPIRVLDATRIRDEKQVIIKIVIPTAKSEGKNEYAALSYFSTPPLKDDPSNHIVPLIDSFPIPNVDSGHFIVMPLLSPYQDPPFYNLAEVHDFLQQIFDGVVFIHNHNVAHCDIASPNILMDAHPLYDERFHPYYQTLDVSATRRVYPKYKRSQKGIRYYFIDLGYAKLFNSSSSPRLATGVDARVAAPEQFGSSAYDPFAVDIYQLGKMVRDDLVQNLDQLEFLSPLVDKMIQVDPTKRPKIEAARMSMNTAFLGLSGWRYRRPLVKKEANFLIRWRALIAALSGELKHLLKRIINVILRRQ